MTLANKTLFYYLPLWSKTGFFFGRFKKTELPKKLSAKKTEAFLPKKLRVPEGFLKTKGKITQFSGFQKGEKVEFFQLFHEI